MKNIKRILLFVLVVATLVMSLAITSCGKCEHSFGDWEATGESTCSGTAEKRVCTKCGEEETRTNGDLTAHKWGEWSVKTAATCTTAGEKVRACTACTAKDSATIEAEGHVGTLLCEKCFGAAVAVPDMDLASYRSIGIDITGLTVNLDYDEDIIESGTISVDVLEGYVGLNDNDELVGSGKGVIKFAAANTTLNNTATISFFIEGTAFYASFEGNQPAGYTNFAENKYIKLDLEATPGLDEAEEALAELEALYPELEAWYTDVFAPIFDSVVIDTSAAEAFAVKVINSLVKKTVADDGSYTITIDFDAIKEFNETLATEKIPAVIDIILGEGVYADIKAYITSDEFYALSVADLVDYLENEQGISIADLFDAIDALLVVVSGADGITLEALLASNEDLNLELPEGFDFAELLVSEDMAELTVMAALKAMLEIEDDPATQIDEAAVAIKAAIAEVIAQFENVTVYELLVSSMPEDDEIIDAISAEPDPIQEIVDSVNDAIDSIASVITFSVNYDKDGKYVSTVVGVDASEGGDTVSITITATETDVTCAFLVSANEYDMDMEIDVEMKIIPGKTVADDAAKLASIKAALAKAPAISEDIFFEAVKADVIWGDDDFAYYIEDGVIYIIEINDVEPANNGAHVSVSAYKYAYTDKFFPLGVTEGCTNVIELSLGVNGYVATGSFDALGAVEFTEEYIKANFLETADKVKSVFKTIPEEAWESESESFVLRYNTSTEEFSYGYVGSIGGYSDTIEYAGHTYVLDEDKSVEASSCDGIGKYHYECSICGDEYDYYYVPGHDYTSGTKYVLADSSAGIAGGFKKVDICGVEGCEGDISDHTIFVESELPAVYYEADDDSCATFKITVETAGVYNIYTDTEIEAYCDTAIVLWSLDGGELTEIDYVDDDTYGNSREILTVELEAGEYVIGIRDWGMHVDAYTVRVTAAVAE